MKNIISFFVCFSFLYMLIQPLRLIFDGGQALSMIIPTVLIIVYDHQYSNRSVLMALLYAIIVFILRSIGVEYFENYLSHIVTTFFSICCVEHYYKTKDDRFAKAVLITFYASFIIMSLISIPQFYLYPEMTRQLLFSEINDERVSSVFYWSIAYSSMHEIPLVLIPLIALYKQKRRRKIIKTLLLLSILILFIALMLGDATTPFLMSCVIILVLFLYNPNRALSFNLYRLGLVSGIFLILMNKTVLVILLSTVQPIFEGTTNYSKIDDTINQIKTGQVEEKSNLGQRELVYDMSKEIFYSHPFGIEKSKRNIGQHSFIIDHLAVMGLFLVLPLVLLTFMRYKRGYKLLPHYRYYYIVAYLAFLTLAYYKNFFLKIEAWFIIPMFFKLLEKKENNVHIRSNN